MDACDNYGRESSIEKVYHYNPYGEVVFESLSSGPVNNYKYSGKEWDDKQKAYDFSARMYMPGIARFTTMDPLCEQDPGHSPYLYCAGNPVNLVDPNGREVLPKGDKELQIIKNTLPEEARDYVQISDDGYIDKNALKLYGGIDNNFTRLLELVETNTVVTVSSQDSFKYASHSGAIGSANLSYFPSDDFLKDVSISIVSGLTTGESGNYGKTLFPDLVGPQNSTSQNIEIYIHPSLSKTGAAEAFSHEGYGHALLYIRNGHNHERASHQIEGMRDTNIILVNMILDARRTTINNLQK